MKAVLILSFPDDSNGAGRGSCTVNSCSIRERRAAKSELIYCSTSWRQRTWNQHSPKQHYDNWCTSTNHRLNRQSNGWECECHIGPQPKTNQLAKNISGANPKMFFQRKWKDRKRATGFRADRVLLTRGKWSCLYFHFNFSIPKNNWQAACLPSSSASSVSLYVAL